ncbi:MAG: hypothetical protein OJF52_003351 [Nitrospira sp.]|nr:MAG: hypothetical protein OJF52_003351 [Nitrospira sp.]
MGMIGVFSRDCFAFDAGVAVASCLILSYRVWPQGKKGL